jgi:prepilin-type N-terminal cleavage/methylation domain-containing protein
MKITKQSGFTLFELLVSISIIGILIAIASFNYSSAQKKARDARRIQDVTAIQKAAEQYYAICNGSYPSAGSVPAFTCSGQTTFNIWPTDPKGVGWTAYTYNIGTTYCACAALENNVGNSTVNNCSNFAVNSAYFCVKSQQ